MTQVGLRDRRSGRGCIGDIIGGQERKEFNR